MIWTLSVELCYGHFAQANWTGTLEIDSNASLAELHQAIQSVIRFDNSHPYEFFIATKKDSNAANCVSFDGKGPAVQQTRVGNLFPLPIGRRLFYLFDYNDCWIFRVNRADKPAKIAQTGAVYPSFVGETGKMPLQYQDCT